MKTLQHRFVEFIPTDLDDDILYISIDYSTIVHKCACGCGYEVVTPLSPTDWQLTFDGETVSLSPSVGNWNFECQSHYWIKNNKIEFTRRWTNREIEFGRAEDKKRKRRFFKKNKKLRAILLDFFKL